MSDPNERTPSGGEGRAGESLPGDDNARLDSKEQGQNRASDTGDQQHLDRRPATPFKDTYRRDILSLASSLHSDLVPSVLAGTPPPGITPTYPFDRDVQETLRLLLQGKRDVALDYLNRLREQGADVRAIFMHVLTPAAARLGHLWEEDRLDFLSVTEATGLLISLMRGLVSGYSRFQLKEPEGGRLPKNILIVTPAGEDHYFGALMLAEFFRFEGWDVMTLLQADEATIADHVKVRMVDCVAYSLSSITDLDALATSIKNIRKASAYQALLVGAGGYYINEDPTRAQRIGADFSAENGAQAIEELNKQLRLIRGSGRGFARPGQV